MHSISIISLVTFICLANVTNGDSILETINKGAEGLKNKVNDMTKSDFDLGVCITNDHCNKSFFKLQNYCCGVQCCDWFTFVFRDNAWENFKTTIENPRANNIVIFVVGILVLSLLISALASLISYFLCGCNGLCCCCGSRKYTIVSRG